MTTATPVPTPGVITPSTPGSSPVEGKKRPLLLWFVIGGLLLLGAVAIGVFALTGGSDDEPLVNDHSAQAGEPALVEVTGYAYSNPATDEAAAFDSMATQANDEVAAMMPAGSADFYTAWSLHEVATSDTDPLAELGLMEINQQFVDDPTFNPEMVVTGIAGGMATAGGTVTTETVEGESVAVAEGPDGEVVFAWYHEGTVSMALGDDEDGIRTFVETYVAEQNS